MFFNILNSMAVGKRRDVKRRAVDYDFHGNPRPTNLTKHLRQAEPRSKGDRCAAWFLTLAATYLAYQIVPTLWQEVWR